MRFLFLFPFILISCGTQNFIDPDLKPYVLQFERAAEAHKRPIYLDGLDIKFQDASANWSFEEFGVCIQNQGFQKQDVILINQKVWKNLDEDHRKYLIFHELGHCALGKDHSPDRHNVMFHDMTLIQFEPEGIETFLETVFE